MVQAISHWFFIPKDLIHPRPAQVGLGVDKVALGQIYS